jgi:hypothetical protein
MRRMPTTREQEVDHRLHERRQHKAPKETGQGTTMEAQPSQMERNPVQGKDMSKKRKYETEDPNITLTWDDAELIADKVQDRSEEVVRTAVVHRGRRLWLSS